MFERKQQTGKKREWAPLSALARLLRSVTQLQSGYDPAAHYMRGPGPACRRKAARSGKDMQQ